MHAELMSAAFSEMHQSKRLMDGEEGGKIDM